MFSKFKNLLKVFKRKIFIVGILCEITIFLPYLVYGNPLFGGQIVSENLKGAQMIADIVGLQILPNIGSVPAASVDTEFQKVELIDKGISKFGSGFVEVLPVDKAGRKIIANTSSEDGSNDAKSASDKRQFIGSKIHFWLIVLSGGFIGVIIGGIIVYVFWGTSINK